MALSTPQIVGFDIGGANIKAASSCGLSICKSFPLWKTPMELGTVLGGMKRELAGQLDSIDRIVVTMTGELADCFLDRREGVNTIVQQSVHGLDDNVLFYAMDGRFVSSSEAVEQEDLIAASNWHALASFAAHWCQKDGLLIDIGSTTSDFIPFQDGRVSTPSRSDHDRLLRGELDYSGIGRTPICAIVDALPFLGQLAPVMNEVFATTDDCALVAGFAREDLTDCNTCDGRPRSIPMATNRMARMIGLDHRQVTLDDAKTMSAYVLERLKARWMVAAQVLSSPTATWVLSGHGCGLLNVPKDRTCLDLSTVLGHDLCRVAPAYAIARLAYAQTTSMDVIPVLS